MPHATDYYIIRGIRCSFSPGVLGVRAISKYYQTGLVLVRCLDLIQCYCYANSFFLSNCIPIIIIWVYYNYNYSTNRLVWYDQLYNMFALIHRNDSKRIINIISRQRLQCTIFFFFLFELYRRFYQRPGLTDYNYIINEFIIGDISDSIFFQINIIYIRKAYRLYQRFSAFFLSRTPHP